MQSHSTEPLCKISLHPVANGDSIIFRVTPPKTQPNGKRAPCDLVLVIDRSASMGSPAPANGGPNEDVHISLLDLVRHTCNSIIDVLDDNDRLAIVTFNDETHVSGVGTRSLVRLKRRTRGHLFFPSGGHSANKTTNPQSRGPRRHSAHSLKPRKAILADYQHRFVVA